MTASTRTRGRRVFGGVGLVVLLVALGVGPVADLALVLVPVIGILAVVSWVSAAVLLYAAHQRPRIGALNERAVIAVVFAVFGTFYTVVTINTTSGYALIPIEVARLITRALVAVELLIPAWWTWLWATGQLGGRKLPPGVRPVLVTDELFLELGAAGVIWGEPDIDGYYHPALIHEVTMP